MSKNRSKRKKMLRRLRSPVNSFAATMGPEDEVDIIHDAAIATAGVNFGKIVPVLFLDTTERPDIVRLVEAHRHLGAGDVTSMFAISKDLTSTVMLFLRFDRPLETRMVLTFSLEKWALVIDTMVQARCVYLQAAKPGETSLFDTEGRLSLDLHVEGFEDEWEKAYLNVAKERLQGHELNRKEVKSLADEMIIESRKLSTFRMPS